MGYNPRVLVIDDEPVVVKSCDRILSGEGFTVDGFSNGRSGLEVAEKSRFDALLLDLKMPDINGIEVLRRIKQSKPEAVVIIITGYPSVDTVVEAMKLGAFDYVVKPFTPVELTGTVKKALKQHERAEEKKQDVERQRWIGPSRFPGQGRSIRTVTTEGKRVAVIGLSGTFDRDSGLFPDLVETLKSRNAPITSEYGSHEITGKEIVKYLEENDRVIVLTRTRMGIGPGKVIKFKAGEKGFADLNTEFAVVKAGLPQVDAWAKSVGIRSELVLVAIEAPRLGEVATLNGEKKQQIIDKVLPEMSTNGSSKTDYPEHDWLYL